MNCSKREAFFEQAALNQGIARQVRDSDDAVIILATTSPSLLSLLSFMSGTFRWFLVLYLIFMTFVAMAPVFGAARCS